MYENEAKMIITKRMIHLGLLILVALLFFIYYFLVRKDFKKCTQPIKATYAGVGSGLGKSFGHTLLFTYYYEGKHYEAAESMTSQNIFSFNRDKMNQKMQQLGYEIGKEYTIYINPDEPRAFISDTKSTYRSLNLGAILIIALVVMEFLKK